VVVSPTDDPYSVRAALASGVRGFVVAGEVTHDPVTRGTTPNGTRLRGLLPGGPDGLSAREVEVLLAWLAAESKEDAAQALFISSSTVSTHIVRIRAKYASVGRPATSKSALFARAVQDGLTTLDEW